MKSNTARVIAGSVAVGLIAVVLAGSSGHASDRTTQKSATASTTTMSVSGCTFTVTYTWSGFSGRDLIATFGLYERKNTLDISFNLHNIEGQVGKSGTVTYTFTLTANASAARTIVGRGSLVNNRTYAQVKNSSSASSTIVSTCG